MCMCNMYCQYRGKSGNDGVGFNGLTCSQAPTPCLICATCMSINRHPYKTPGWNNCAPLRCAVIYHTTRHWYQYPGYHHTRGCFTLPRIFLLVSFTGIGALLSTGVHACIFSFLQLAKKNCS
jgi:hypothetical protein